VEIDAEISSHVAEGLDVGTGLLRRRAPVVPRTIVPRRTRAEHLDATPAVDGDVRGVDRFRLGGRRHHAMDVRETASRRGSEHASRAHRHRIAQLRGVERGGLRGIGRHDIRALTVGAVDHRPPVSVHRARCVPGPTVEATEGWRIDLDDHFFDDSSLAGITTVVVVVVVIASICSHHWTIIIIIIVC